MTDDAPTIYPVLLSGGSGSRLWPLSRENAPKQLLRLIGEGTLLQQTARRALDASLFGPLTVIGSSDHRFMMAEQLRDIAAGATLVLEPTPRNTAAAAAVAARLVKRWRPDGLMLLMPADHLIGDVAAFRDAVRNAAVTARNGYLTLFGIAPSHAATGYGYIRAGESLGAGPGRHVAAFVEKPDQETADVYLADGNYLWNSGIFLMPAGVLLAELEAFEPDLVAASGEALERAERDADFVRLDGAAFERCRSISIDRAVMERTQKAAIVPASFDWADVGSWSALWALAERDEAGNATTGEVFTWATRTSYIRSDGPLIATLGVDDLIVVATDDAVLVARKGNDQNIREIVERLKLEKPERI